LTIAQASWGEVAAELLRDCFTVPGALEKVAAQVEAGVASLFMVDQGDEIVAAFVLRVDGDEGVIVAFGGPVALSLELLPHMEARFSGVRVIRAHTARPGVAHLLARREYGAAEIVLRKVL
jgi:hypothetical protein